MARRIPVRPTIGIEESYKLRRLYSKIPDSALQEDLLILQDLTDCDFDGRYPGEEAYELTKESAIEFLEVAKRIYGEVCKLIETASADVF